MLSVIAILVVPRIAAEPSVAVITLALTLLSLVLASIVSWRLPRHPAGALLAANGVATLAVLAAGDVAGTPLEGDWMLLYVFLAELLLVMPTGRLARRGHVVWRIVVLCMPLIVAIFIALNAYLWRIGDEPFPLVAVSLALVVAYFACLIAAVVSLALRSRESDARDRLGLRWMFFGGATVPLTLALCWLSFLLLESPELVIFGLLVMQVAIPAAATIALVRPLWFDIDSATLAAVTVSGLAFGVLGGVSIANALAGLALVTWSPIVGIVVTLVLGVLAIPLYRMLRRVIARALYPRRERALAALRVLRTQMEAGSRSPEDLEAVLRSALRDPSVRITYRSIGDGASVVMGGEQMAPGAGAMVMFLGEEIGAIHSADGSPVSQTVCAAAAPILDAVRLRAELTRAMREVAASRERLVLAGYEERRRLERDLHDGAQQRLVSLGMRLRVLQRTVPGAAQLADSLDGAVAELGTAVAELRQLAHGVRPSALNDGLPSALADLQRLAPHAIELSVEVDSVPDAVATTAYFVASEAVANAIKHAQAARIRIVARCELGELHLIITDDGRGGACPASGIEGLRDRVAAHGGQVSVHSPAGSGTSIEAVIPCTS
jgi:signal transduction histidine kinase